MYSRLSTYLRTRKVATRYRQAALFRDARPRSTRTPSHLLLTTYLPLAQVEKQVRAIATKGKMVGVSGTCWCAAICTPGCNRMHSSLQPHALKPVTARAPACNRTHSSLQPYVLQVRGGGHLHVARAAEPGAARRTSRGAGGGGEARRERAADVVRAA